MKDMTGHQLLRETSKLRKKRLRVEKPGFSVPSQCEDSLLEGTGGHLYLVISI